MIPAMHVTLTVTQGPHRGEVFEFHEHDTFIVGRSRDAQFRLPFKDKALSRVHFMVEVNPPRCRLMDMASLNGTFVNGQRATTTDLGDGDTIKAGRTVIAVAIGQDAPTGPAPADESLPGSAATTVTLDVPIAAPAIPRYRIERELGRGGMGVVYRARREADEAVVALKTITPAVVASGNAVARFLREAAVLRQLDHPNIVRFEEIGHDDGRLYFVMEYVPGADACALAKRYGGTLPIGRAVGLACQALEALEYAHAKGFVHRDIKPHNLLVAAARGRDRLKLADFGLARTYQGSPLSGLTLTGQISGTPSYLAPEQITHFRQSQPPVDQYGLAATLYYLLTGRKVHDFPADAPRQLMMILQEDPVPIRTRRPDLPEELAAVIHRALARDPADRFPDAAAMRAALIPFLSR